MKVICIDSSTDRDSPLPVDLIEGDIYTVIGKAVDGDILWYILAEKDADDGYSHDAFIPVSEIDETEFKRNYQTQTA